MIRHFILALALLLSACTQDGTTGSSAGADILQTRAAALESDQPWVPVWGTAIQAAYPFGFPVDPAQPGAGGTVSPYFLPTPAGVSLSYPLLTVFPAYQASNQTLRQIVRTTVAASSMRLVLSNRFGSKPLDIQDVHVGIRGPGATVVEGTNTRLTFNGQSKVSIPVGKTVASDSFNLPVLPTQELAISTFLPGTTGQMSWHASSMTTSYATDPDQGNHAARNDGWIFKNPMGSWFFIDRIEAQIPGESESTIAILGDSITDGVYASFDKHDRWTDVLSRRLVQTYGNRYSVLNLGIGGNQILIDSPQSKSGLSRLEEDVLCKPGVKFVIVSLGINDINFNTPAAEVIKGLQRLAQQIRNAGKVPIATTLGPTYVLTSTLARNQVNEWIRTSKTYDHMLDFDKVLSDEQVPVLFKSAYFSGDNLHPNSAGFKAMGESIDLNIFR